MNPWIIRIGVLAVILFILDREIYMYEGVHLGSRVQGWLYDRWAAKYDKDKAKSQVHDVELLAQPLLKALAETQPDKPDAILLDIATGTGRLPFVLLQEEAFKGQIIGLDISREMMALSVAKIADQDADRVTWLQHTAVPLPFPDASFDVVACMEALEIMPNMQEPLAEIARVLRPGGILMATHGTPKLNMRRKTVSEAEFTTRLNDLGFEQVEILPWWEAFNRVWARKQGASEPIGARLLTEILRCPQCQAIALSETENNSLCCGECATEWLRSPEGIILAG